MHRKQGLPGSAGLGDIEQSPTAIAAVVTGRKSVELPSTLSSPAILFTNYAAPCRQALGRMLLHPFGELRRAHQAGLHRDFGEVRRGDSLFVAIRGSGEAAEHGDDLDHARPPSPRRALTPSAA